MSAFLEEYGKIIVVIIVIAALIVLAILFRDTGTENASQSFNSFMGVAQDAVGDATNAAGSAGT